MNSNNRPNLDELELELAVQELDPEHSQHNEMQRLTQLKAFAQGLVAKRKEAVDGRKSSGIEDIWREDDEYYDGIDEVNRGESMLKPASLTGSPYYSRSDSASKSSRSTVFVNITQPYVDMASSRVADMLLPTDDKPFSIQPTPLPDVVKSADDHSHMPDGQATVAQAAQAMMLEMDTKAAAAETQIWDWLVESNWHSEMRKVIEQAARIGSGVIKGPFPSKSIKRKVDRNQGEIKMVIDVEIKPTSKQIDVWNLYPDPSCGQSIHDGDYVFEQDTISARQLREMIGVDGYIESEIKELLQAGPNKKNIDSKGKTLDTDKFDIWYYYGNADSDDMQASGCDCEDGDQIPVVVAMVEDRVIKAGLSVLESGEFPYDVMVWQRRVDHWAGLGVSRQTRTSQRMVNAASRNMLDNAGVAAGPQMIINTSVIYPMDGQWSITPMKLWGINDDADVQDVQRAFAAVQIPMMQAEMGAIIKMGMEFAERATSMPLLMQGNQGSATETVGGMTILDRNASSVLRRIAKISDDDVTEPHITRYYEWLLLYGKDDAMKGDMNIISLGSSAFYERDAQNQAIMTLLPMAQNPAFNLDPDKLMSEILKMNKISPERVRFSEQDIKQMKEAAQKNPPQDPAMQIAQLRASSAEKIAQGNAQSSMQVEQLKQQSWQQETDAKVKEAQGEMSLKLHLAQQDHDNKMALAQVQYQIEIMKLSESSKQSLADIKAQLAATSMKLNVQQSLSNQALQVDAGNTANTQAHERATQLLDHNHEKSMQASTPLVEPAGHAPDGQAYEL